MDDLGAEGKKIEPETTAHEITRQGNGDNNKTGKKDKTKQKNRLVTGVIKNLHVS